MHKCFVLRVFNCTALSTKFLRILRDQTMIFVGVKVGGDLDKILRDYYCTEVIKNIKTQLI